MEFLRFSFLVFLTLLVSILPHEISQCIYPVCDLLDNLNGILCLMDYAGKINKKSQNSQFLKFMILKFALNLISNYLLYNQKKPLILFISQLNTIILFLIIFFQSKIHPRLCFISFEFSKIFIS